MSKKTGWTTISVTDPKAKDLDRLVRDYGEPDFIFKRHGGSRVDTVYTWWEDKTNLERHAGHLGEMGIHEVIKSPVPINILTPDTVYVQAKKEGDTLYHTTSTKRLMVLEPQLSTNKFVSATTHPLRHTSDVPMLAGAFGSGVLDPHMYEVGRSDERKFRPVLYKIPNFSKDALEQWRLEVQKQGFRFISADEVMEEYGKDWYKYVESGEWINENEWRAFEPIKVSYVGDVRKIYGIRSPRREIRVIDSEVQLMRMNANAEYFSDERRQRYKAGLIALQKYFGHDWTWNEIKSEAKKVGVHDITGWSKYGALLALSRKEYGSEVADMLSYATVYRDVEPISTEKITEQKLRGKIPRAVTYV